MALNTSTITELPRENLRLDERALLQYMRQHVKGLPPAPCSLRVTQFTHGQSNPTYLLEASGPIPGGGCGIRSQHSVLEPSTMRGQQYPALEPNASGTQAPTPGAAPPLHVRYVLRKKPPGALLASAHAVDREFRIMSALQGTQVPVPRVLSLCEDESVIGTPFYIMEHVNGRIFSDPNLPGLTPHERRAVYAEMAGVLAKLHAVDVSRVGLDDYGRRESYCRRQVDRWAKQYHASAVTEDARMDALVVWLQNNVPPEDDTLPGGIVHGDFRLDNLIFHPTELRVLAVLDWELSTLGNPMSDLAYNCLPYHLPEVKFMLPSLKQGVLAEGVPSELEFIRMYQRLMGPAGQPISTAAWKFYLGLSLFRAAAILAGVHRRSLQGNASAKDAQAAGPIVVQLAERAHEIIAGKRAVADLGATCAGSPPLFLNPTGGGVGQSTRTPVVGADGDDGCAGFSPPPHVKQLRDKLLAFMDEHVYPNEAALNAHALSDACWTIHPLMEQLKIKARHAGLWNLWLPRKRPGAAGASDPYASRGGGLSNLEYAHLCKIMGRSLWAPEIFNCGAPDTGNMEVLERYGTPDQKQRWLEPLLEGRIRSCFAMTEPAVASSDATNIQASIVRQGDEYVINAHKWWTSGAMDPRCEICILMVPGCGGIELLYVLVI
eukprot:jgi/Mesvir1/6273/Mv19978-RA.2